MNIFSYRIIVLLSPLLLVSPSFADVKCKTRYSACQKQLKSGVYTDGRVKGRIKETRNKIYVKGIKIYQKNSDKPALQVVTRKGDKKRVIVKNVKVYSKNADISTNNGMASTVGLHLENRGNTIDNLTINSAGHNKYSTISNNKQNSAGVNVMQLSEHTKVSDVVINSHGSNFIKAVQNIP